MQLLSLMARVIGTTHRIMTVTGTQHKGHEPTWNIGNTANPIVKIKSHTPWELTSLGCVRPNAVGLCIFPCLGGSIAGTLRVMSVQSIAFNSGPGPSHRHQADALEEHVLVEPGPPS